MIINIPSLRKGRYKFIGTGIEIPPAKQVFSTQKIINYDNSKLEIRNPATACRTQA